jgi:hypothetical protein
MDIGSVADWFSGAMTLFAAIVALGGYWLVFLQRKQDKKEIQYQAGNQIGLKLENVINASTTIHKYIKDALRDYPANKQWKFARVPAFLGIEYDPIIQLNTIESTFLTEAKATNFLMEMIFATRRYQTIIIAMKEYNFRYHAFQELKPPPSAMSGVVGHIDLTEDQFLKLQPYAHALDNLLNGLLVMTKENIDKSQQLITNYNQIMERHFKGKNFAILSPLNDVS